MEEVKLVFLDPQQVQPDPGAIRHDPGDIESLAASIAGQGLLQPIGVIHMWGDTYRVVFGHRRLAAARHLDLAQIPCILLEADPDELFIPQLVENLHRLDLNDMEKAEAVSRLRQHLERQQPHLSEGELDTLAGQTIGFSARTVRRYLTLLELSPSIQELIREGSLTVTQAQHLVRIPNPATREEVAREAAEEGLTAAQVSQLAAFFAANPNLTIETALQALEEGVRLRREVPPEPVEGPPQKLARVPLEEGERVWEEGEEAEEFPAGPEASDWARLRRFDSLDEVLDEAGRISRSFYEGDVEKWASSDEQAPTKVRLLLRQLRAVVETLESLCRARGWVAE
jgi:ParB family chromosome partitioning protein